MFDVARGREDFRYPKTRDVLGLAPHPPDVVHLHNLHGGYFDLRALPALATAVPLVATLHDAWLLTGHCAHPLDSDKWRSGCGDCPHLDTYPPLRRDGTAYNIRRKSEIYERLQLAAVTPCAWLMVMVDDSVLAPAVTTRRIIPYGVDLDVFHPGVTGEARPAGIPEGQPLIIFAAQGGRANRFKDFDLLVAALTRLGKASPTPVTAVALGADAPEQQLGLVTLRSVPPVERDEVAAWLRAADVYVHPARADTFPLAILEALACGTPVVATRVGGIPEQVRALGEVDDPTGALVDCGDDEALAEALRRLLDDRDLRLRLGESGARDACSRFDAERQVRAYLDLYDEVLEKPSSEAVAAAQQ
jgi:glycosyltransferase involved in cell wall biosynthesis